jgi:hypothetical protein
MKSINKLTVILLVVLGMSNTATAASIGTNGLSTGFAEGSTSFNAVISSGSAFNENYLILGAGIGYYLMQGLEVGIDAQYWFNGDPSITKITPKITYVFTQFGNLKPYLGTFYRRTIFGEVDGFEIEDKNSYGYRAGAYFSSKNGVNIGAGLIHEQYLDCDPRLDCSETYPEMILSFNF